jgi:hypothetical protein
MPEIGTSGLMSGDGKRGDGLRPQATAPILDSTIPEVGQRAMVRLVVSIPAIRRCEISDGHSVDRMPCGSRPRFEAK